MQKGDCERAPRRDATRAHSVPGAQGRSTEFSCPSHFHGKLGGEFRQGATMEHQPGKKKTPQQTVRQPRLEFRVEGPSSPWGPAGANESWISLQSDSDWREINFHLNLYFLYLGTHFSKHLLG